MADTTGQANLRAETISKIVNGFALQEYKFKQALTINNSNSWKESYFQENATELTGGANDSIRGIPRLANFPYGEPNWTKTSSYLEKYGMEGVISWEDEATNEIDVVARTLLRIARAVAKSVDDQIFSVLTTATNVQTFTISAGKEWNNVSGSNIIDNLMRAKKLIVDYNYNPEGAWLFINQTDHRSIVTWLANKGAQFPSISESATNNGKVGNLCNVKIIVSPSVTVSGALLVVDKEAATWKSAVPLTIKTIEDPGIKKIIRAWEVGVTQVTNPRCIVWIKNTDNGIDYS